ncbi:hypothetical protein Clacol_004180 [Clathrus columnatus]|uniref:Copper acquisition factor BIM1-like domain-containing protein n=1 Tax=Clathrus columnatus TaxID=1419009 RepID=A0AAV5AAB8_9AGAM|nr:hypothetical protein Clacol_004180 [Clathrus columnatus]
MADILIGLSTLENPTTFAQFNHTANGTTYPFLTPFTVMHAQGDACFPVNASALGISEVHNGADATIMVQFDGPDGVLFQCADVILDANATVPTSVKCDNATGAFPTSTSSGSSSGSSNTNMATTPLVFSYASTLVAGFIITGALLLL